MNSFIQNVQYSKRVLDSYTFTELKYLSTYLDLPKSIKHQDLTWIIALNLLTNYKTSQMPPKVTWDVNIESEREVPVIEPETRKGLDDIEWTKLKYKIAARVCIQYILGKHNIWSIESLEKLLNDPKKISQKNLYQPQLMRMNSCLRILKNTATQSDIQLVKNYNRAITRIRKRKITEKLDEIKKRH